MFSQGYKKYKEVSGDYYYEITNKNKVGHFRAWYHKSRFNKTNNLVKKYIKKDSVILDLACGNCTWNSDQLPVVGFDTNENVLDHALKGGRIKEKIIGDVYDTKLESESADIIILSEVLEHLERIDDALKEIRRVLKKDGIFIMSVPYDRPFTPFYVLFGILCFIEGDIKGNEFHKQRWGHINHFSRKDIRNRLIKNGFGVKELVLHNYFLIYSVATKK
ncbi:hypothetical protein CL622_05995 [archaeon]|nr:hypothetical protein [archaeon]|tara:strand:- start:3039 stop:3695 length:657 start_codon:yes stop_codon:yes gene_type:complete